MSQESNQKIGAIVRSCRLSQGATQYDLAKAIGVTVMTISMIEQGKIKIPSKRLGQFCQLLNLPKKRIYNIMVAEYKAKLSKQINNELELI